MASPFWKYFSNTLRWALIDKPGPLQAVTKGLAHRLDGVRDDVSLLRAQFFPQLCEPVLVPAHGVSRGVIRHHTETPEQYRKRVINAYAWHKLGGKWEGLPQILKFYGFDIAELEGLSKYQSSRWAEFQIGFADSESLEEHADLLASLETLVWLINEYKPARSILARLYNDTYNITPLIWSEGNYSDHFYSHFSGVPASNLGDNWKDEELLLSFGHRLGIQTAPIVLTSQPAASGEQVLGIEARYISAPVWSYFNYSDDFAPAPGSSVLNVLNVDWCERLTESYSWEGQWNRRQWEEKAHWGRRRPQWTMEITGLARSQLAYSGSTPGEWIGVWGGLNACYGVPTAVVVNSPNIWGAFCYSDDTEFQEIEILEQETSVFGVEAAPINTNGMPEASFTGTLGATPPPLHNQTWSGNWDNRRWHNYVGVFSITSQTKEP